MRSGRSSSDSGFSRLDIARAVALMVVVVAVVGAALERDDDGPDFPLPTPTEESLPPIAGEADVFRLRGEALSVAPGFVGNDRAHVRSPEIYRRNRAYPGAPPRIPHGLTEEEFRRASCNVCHERGGWVARFGAYAPVTPHAELTSCLQCHVPSDELVGLGLPASPDALVCSQCHVDPDTPAPSYRPVDWRPAAWPDQDLQVMAGSPHLIPHDVERRSNCLACHAGPGAVVGLRTDHPERVNCRQCHVSISDEEPFSGVDEGTGAVP